LKSKKLEQGQVLQLAFQIIEEILLIILQLLEDKLLLLLIGIVVFADFIGLVTIGLINISHKIGHQLFKGSHCTNGHKSRQLFIQSLSVSAIQFFPVFTFTFKIDEACNQLKSVTINFTG